MRTSNLNSKLTGYLQIKSCCKGVLFLTIVLSLCLHGFVHAQEADSVKTDKDKSIRSAWANRPPSGGSEKTQGGLLMLLGASSVLGGAILLNKEDPCDAFSSPNVICTSNIDEVRAQGAIALGVGAGAIIYGIVRYAEGAKKAKAYEEWKKKYNMSFRPEIRFGYDWVEFALVMAF